MKKANYVISIVATISAIVLIVISLGYPGTEAYGTGTPGPGLWPICIAVILLLMSLFLVIKTINDKTEDEKVELTSVDQIRVYATMLILLIYFVVLKPVGFLIPSFLMLTFFIYWFSKAVDESYIAPQARSRFARQVYLLLDIKDGLRQERPLWLCSVYGAAISLGVYFVFKKGLNVPMNFGLYI